MDTTLRRSTGYVTVPRVHVTSAGETVTPSLPVSFLPSPHKASRDFIRFRSSPDNAADPKARRPPNRQTQAKPSEKLASFSSSNERLNNPTGRKTFPQTLWRNADYTKMNRVPCASSNPGPGYWHARPIITLDSALRHPNTLRCVTGGCYPGLIGRRCSSQLRTRSSIIKHVHPTSGLRCIRLFVHRVLGAGM